VRGYHVPHCLERCAVKKDEVQIHDKTDRGGGVVRVDPAGPQNDGAPKAQDAQQGSFLWHGDHVFGVVDIGVVVDVVARSTARG